MKTIIDLLIAKGAQPACAAILVLIIVDLLLTAI